MEVRENILNTVEKNHIYTDTKKSTSFDLN